MTDYETDESQTYKTVAVDDLRRERNTRNE
jgi:hypothetical protein